MTGNESLYEVLLYVSVAVFGATTFAYLRSGRASMFHPATVYLALHFVIFVVRPLVAFYNDYDLIYKLYEFHPSWVEKIIVICCVNIGLIVFVAGVLAFGNAKPRLAGISDRQLRDCAIPMVITTFLVGIPGAISLYQNYNAESQQLLDLNTGITINTTGNGYFIDAQLMLATLVGMIAFVFRFRWWSLLPFAAYVFFRAGTGGRGPFIAAIFFIMLLYLFRERKRWLTAVTTTLGVGALFLFRLVGDDRGAAIQRLMGFESEREFHEQRFLESMDWANLEFFEYLVYVVPKRSGAYDKFASLLQIFTEPIPRVLWPDKPLGAPIEFFRLFDYGSPIGITYSLPGAGWIELGWLGVIIMCLVFACIYGKAYNIFMTSEQSPTAVMIYFAFAATSLIAFRDGVLITILKQSLFYLTPVFIFAGLQWLFQPGQLSLSDARAGPLQDGEGSMTPGERRRARMRQLGRPA